MPATQSHQPPSPRSGESFEIAVRRGRTLALTRMQLQLAAMTGTHPKPSADELEAIDHARDALATLELRLSRNDVEQVTR